MKVIEKESTVTKVIIMMSNILVRINNKVTNISKSFFARRVSKVALIAKDFITDDYLRFIREEFEDIQRKKPEEVEFIFYDSQSNIAIQNEIIDKVLREGIDLILLDLADTRVLQETIDKIKQYDVPVIFFNREPLTLEPIKPYKKALYIGTDSIQSGILQGKIIVDAWKNNKNLIDRNRDNVLQYIVLQGERYNMVPINRTQHSVATIQAAGIEMEELALVVGQWDEETAKNEIEALFLKYGDRIEAIISNDDTMAIGAIKALQKYGYNQGNKTKTIAVVGVDAVPEARELIDKGIMLGSIIHYPIDLVEVLYSVGMNLANNRDPLEGTQYKFDETGVAVRIPFREEYVKK